MVEILWKSEAPHIPAQNQELCELRLVDMGSSVHPRFVVREIHAAWSAEAQQIQWKGFRDHSCRTPEEARRQYERRRASIVRKGFAYTTLVG